MVVVGKGTFMCLLFNRLKISDYQDMKYKWVKGQLAKNNVHWRSLVSMVRYRVTLMVKTKHEFGRPKCRRFDN